MSTITLITGANQGIGLAVATALARDHGHQVIIGSRTASAGEKAAATIREAGHAASSVQLDVTSDDSIAAAIATIEKDFGHLDVLINNAGIIVPSKGPSPSHRQMYQEIFETNTIGAACVTEAALPLLRKSKAPKVIFVSSRMGSLQQATDRNTLFYAMDYRAYDASKAAMNMVALQYSRILSDVGAKVNVVCPGLCKTQATGYIEYGDTPEQGAIRAVELAVAGEDGPIETFSDRNGAIAW